MTKYFFTSCATLLLLAGYGHVYAVDSYSSANDVIEHCKKQAEGQAGGNVQDNISSCIDDLLQYDTSDD
jgi:hypothetical protein